MKQTSFQRLLGFCFLSHPPHPPALRELDTRLQCAHTCSLLWTFPQSARQEDTWRHPPTGPTQRRGVSHGTALPCPGHLSQPASRLRIWARSRGAQCAPACQAARTEGLRCSWAGQGPARGALPPDASCTFTQRLPRLWRHHQSPPGFIRRVGLKNRKPHCEIIKYVTHPRARGRKPSTV